MTEPTTIPELPTLERGIHLLDVDESAVGPLQSLALDHILTTSGEARWIDAKGYATTTTLARLAPDGWLLERVQVARGFTAYQHHELLDRLESAISPETTLVVCPAIDALYREAKDGDAGRLFESAIQQLHDLVETYELTILATRTRDDAFTKPLVAAAEQQLACTRTQFGPRFIGDEFETLVYPGNGYIQTTLAFWERVLTERQAVHTFDSSGVTALGTN